MKGQCKRFVNLKGESYDTNVKLKRKQDENIGFLSMWRYSTTTERLVTIFGVFLGTLSSFGTIGGIVIYGELTALFVTRHKGVDISGDQYVLRAFGGGKRIPPGDSELHMSALVDDSIAFAIASLVIITLHIIIAAVAVTIVGWAAARMVSRLRIRLLRSVISQEIAFFDTNTTMNFASTLTEDMEKFRGGVGEHVVMTANLAGTVLLGAALALTYGWQLTLAGLAVVPISVFIAMLVAKNQTKYSSEEVKAYGAAGRVVEEALSSVQTVRAYGGEDEEVRRYVSALALGGPATRGRGTWAGAGAGLGWFLTYALNSVVLAYGAQLCVRDMDLPPEDQEYHPGIMVTVLFLTSMAAQNIAMCQPHLEVFSAARGAARALFALVERDPAVPARAQGARPPAFRGDLGFDNLYFNYPSRPDVKVLRGLTLHVKAGETVALVGPSGCGKSTLLQLLQRLYEPEAGSIAVDGHRLTELDLHYFRKSIGVVGQEPVLFSGSVRENITLGAEGVAQGDVERAARLANAHPFIVKLKHGYDTVLDAGGAQLSGGQKQRLAIARAVLREPPILLLDEPTSALDPRAERLVQAALDSASKGRTTLVVSHRLATIVNASRIVYIEQGSVLEQGTHAELLEKKGAYWKLVQEDMTQRDLSEQLLAESQEEDEAPLEPEPFVRCLSRASNCVRGSTSSFARGSLRLSPAGRVPVSTDVTDIDTEESEEDEKAPEVSSLALLKLNAKEWPLLMGGALASLVMGTIMPLFALLFSWIYGMFALSDKAEILALARLYAGLFAGIAALCGVFTFLQTWLFNLAGAKLTARLREITFRNYLNQEQGWFDRAQNSVGALCARLGSDAGAVQGATGTRLGTALQGAATMLIGITLAMCFSWKMTLVSLVSVPCVIGGIYLESLVNRRSEVKERKALELASRIATEAVLNVRTVHSLGVEEWVLSRYCAAVRAARVEAGAARRARGPVYGLCVCAPTVGYAVSLAYGGYLVAREGLPYQYAILVSEALIYGAWMLAAALAFAPSFAAAKRSGARIIAALERTPTVVTEPSAEEIQGWSPTGEVQYKGVHFSYPARAGTPVLKGVSLRVPPGATLALVGPSGCGKSTLMQLLLRNYDPNSGSIELDGKNIKRTLTLPQLRHQLGLVPQEPALFTRSIRDNIAYGDHSRLVPMDEIIEAAKQANVHTFVAGLPMGYDTMIGGGKGASLSGGQKQRLGIARALVRKPRLLLLDEPTSALDANSEKVVQAALEAAAKGRTTIIIAHRLATVQHADVICVIDKGVVAETGSHEELLKKQGIYWELWRQQTSQASNTDS